MDVAGIRRLSMFHFYKNKTYSMPVFFGGTDYSDYRLIANDVFSILFVQESTEEALAPYLPGGYNLVEPKIFIQYFQLREVNFLYGGAYNVVQVSLPVHFKGKEDFTRGFLPLVIWENEPISIVMGREKCGMPKVFADISDSKVVDDIYYANGGIKGNSFFSFEVIEGEGFSDEDFDKFSSDWEGINLLGIRYIPAIGTSGAELIQKVVHSQYMQIDEVFSGKGSFKWRKLDNYKGLDSSKIVNQLCKFPVVSSEEPIIMSGRMVMKPNSCWLIN